MQENTSEKLKFGLKKTRSRMNYEWVKKKFLSKKFLTKKQ